MTERYNPPGMRMMQLFMSHELIARIDAYRRSRTVIPARTEAIRALLADALSREPVANANAGGDEISLRTAVERAQASSDDPKVREWLQWLLDQKSDGYGTLIDECEVAIHG
jgi:hypothetical protein